MIAVIGGGIVGLSTAWELSRLGHDVTVLDSGAMGGGASGAATAYLEPRLGTAPRHDAERHALRLWDDWSAELERASGLSVHLRRDGQMRVALDTTDGKFAQEMADRQAAGWDVELLTGDRAHALEPWLTTQIAQAAHLKDVQWVDGRAVCAAMGEALHNAGASLRPNWPVRRIDPNTTLHGPNGDTLVADRVLIANGMGANTIEGRPADVPRCRPVRGVNLVLDVTDMRGAPRHLIKHARGTICPRRDGARDTLLVGTTYENNVDEALVAPDIVERLYANAEPVLPNVRSLPLLRVEAGVRVKVGNGQLSLGRSGERPDIFWSLGHAGAGFLRAPLVAPGMARFVTDGGVDPFIEEAVTTGTAQNWN